MEIFKADLGYKKLNFGYDVKKKDTRNIKYMHKLNQIPTSNIDNWETEGNYGLRWVLSV